MTNKPYKLVRNTHYIVLSTSYRNPLESEDTIAADLRTQSYKGPVTFDLLLCNGDEFNRFIEIYFNGDDFEVATTRILPRETVDINMHNSLYADHRDTFNFAILPKVVRFDILNR